MQGSDWFSGVIICTDEYQWLEISGSPLQMNEQIEIAVMGYWITGSIQRDAGGWYLLTDDEVGIRLRTGLRARRPLFPPSALVE
ncbi:hypothetical protein KSF_002780 [Reticulibacter mediterranei]|uniref:DUF5348 domain-containing protein n=1 Tax=Reticulibacter mediterranei TaxID=2778369 RepID=A0A8J3ID36_9CHLR|nr:DUF5348 domain-containing protein [Reticulibacter mediterranei]GHO90230.1 hypothetical protein KSF_002780 [Reticulibacter mediterranei]